MRILRSAALTLFILGCVKQSNKAMGPDSADPLVEAGSASTANPAATASATNPAASAPIADRTSTEVIASCAGPGPGSGLACDHLGDAYVAGTNETPKDPARAVKYYRRSCDKGTPLGCTHLARLYIDGSPRAPWS